MLAEGNHRKVYTLAHTDLLVVKYPLKEGKQRNNLAEYLVWSKAPEPVRRWLVPVVACHPEGEWLVMLRGSPIEPDTRPEPAPQLVDVAKDRNWVKLGGKVLLCDYGQLQILKNLGIPLNGTNPQ
jgi:hypothetical protein